MSALEEFDTGLSLADLDPESPRPIETPWGTMALYRHGDEVTCWQAFCPHMEGPLFEGTLSRVEGTGSDCNRTVTCPWHRWRYDLQSGARLEPSKADDPLDDPLVGCEVSRSAKGTVLLRRPSP